METIVDNRFSIWSSNFASSKLEFADDNKRAELKTIPPFIFLNMRSAQLRLGKVQELPPLKQF